METILRNLYGVIYRCKNDADWTMEFINDGIYILSGYTKDELLSGKITFGQDIIHPDDQDQIWEQVQNHMDQRLPFELEYRITTKSGIEKWVLERGQGIYDEADGSLRYLEGFITDISKQKHTELELEKAKSDLSLINKSKDKLFSIVAHDIKSPINNLKSWLDIIATTEISKEQFDELVGNFHEHIDKVLSMLEALLEWSRTQLSGFTHSPTNFDILELIQEVVDIAKDTATKKGIQLETHSKDEESEVFADRNHIQVVLRNIISNAIKFTDPMGKVNVTISNQNKDIKISVSDSGKGMAQSEIDKLFNIQTHFSTEGTSNETGTGLGLLLCKEMTNKNGGEIWLESQPDKGTTVHFTIPIPVEIPSIN